VGFWYIESKLNSLAMTQPSGGSVGNLKDYGNKGNNFPFQMRLLQALGIIAKNTSGGGGGACCPAVARTPSLLRVTNAGTVAAGKRSVSVYNAGNNDGTWLGAVIKPGEQFNFDAGSNLDTLGAFAYDGTGTELVITTIV
jgi:hypothetical protein